MKSERKWPKIDPAFKKRWLKALRSGEYKGATGLLCALKNNGEPRGFCCLGVAGHLAGMPVSQFGDFGMLDGKVIKGFKTKIPKALQGSGDLPSILARMNDNKHGFKRIADWIEKNL